MNLDTLIQQKREEFDKKHPWGTFHTDEDRKSVKSFLESTIREVVGMVCEEIVENALMLSNYAEHQRNCILSRGSAGRPTEDGGYEHKYGDKWYRSRPVDETPECECGLSQLIQKLATAKEKGFIK